MPTRRVVVRAHNGAHARPVAELVRLAQAHGSRITLRTTAGTSVDLRSVLAVMDLAIGTGDVVELETGPSPEAEAVLDRLAAVLDPG